MIRQRNIARGDFAGMQVWSDFQEFSGALSQHEGWGIRMPNVLKVDVFAYGGHIQEMTSPPNGMHFGIAFDQAAPTYSGAAAVVNDEMGSDYFETAADDQCYKWLNPPLRLEIAAPATQSGDVGDGLAADRWDYAGTLRIVFYNETNIGGAGSGSSGVITSVVYFRPWFINDDARIV